MSNASSQVLFIGQKIEFQWSQGVEIVMAKRPSWHDRFNTAKRLTSTWLLQWGSSSPQKTARLSRRKKNFKNPLPIAPFPNSNSTGPSPNSRIAGEFWIRTSRRAPSRAMLRKRRPSRQYQKRDIYTNIYILGVDMVDAAGGKAETMSISRPPPAASRTSGAAKPQTIEVSWRVCKSSLPLQNHLAGDKRSLSRERLISERTDIIDTAEVCKQTALMGNEVIAWTKDLPETAWDGSLVAKVGGVGTDAIATKGLFPGVGDATGATQEGDQGRNAISSTASSWTYEKQIGWLDVIWKEKCRNQREGDANNNKSVEKQQQLTPMWHNASG